MTVPRISTREIDDQDARSALVEQERLQPPVGPQPSYWSVLWRLIKASPLLVAVQLLPISFAMALLVLYFPNGAAEPLLVALASGAMIALSMGVVAIPGNPAGAVLLSDIGRGPFGLLPLLAAAWKGTLVQLITVTTFLFAWAYSVGHAAKYAVQNFGTNYEAAETTMLSSIWIVGGVAFMKMAITSTLTMIDVQYGGPPTIGRSVNLFFRSPFRAVGAGLLALLGTLIGSTVLGVIVGFFELGPLAASAGQIAIAAWCFTVAIFAHYRVVFGEHGAG